MMTNDKHVGPVNLGNPNEIKIIDAAKEVMSLVNSKSTLDYLDLPQDDPKQRQPDISLARKILGWDIKIDRKTGFLSTIDYFKENL